MRNLYLRLFKIDLITIDVEWRFDYVQDTFWRFYVNSSDGATVWIGDHEVPLLKDRLYFIPSGVSFTGRNIRSLQHFYVHFDVIGLPPHLLRRLQSGLIRLDRNDRLEQALSDAVQQFSSRGATDFVARMRVTSVLYEALALAIGALPEDPSLQSSPFDTAPIQAALDWIDGHLSDRLQIRELAQRCHMSEDYFIKRFRLCIGQTPNRYIQGRRIIAAAQDLLFTSATIEQIAERSGFGNRFYFARVFAKAHRRISSGLPQDGKGMSVRLTIPAACGILPA